MKLSVALFFAGIFGALATLCVLLSFGTDYWLLASERCLPVPAATVQPGEVAVEVSITPWITTVSAVNPVVFDSGLVYSTTDLEGRSKHECEIIVWESW